MSETEQPSPNFDPEPQKDRRWSLRPNTQAAVLEVLERRRQGLRPAYRMVAIRHGVTENALRTSVSRVTTGQVKLAPTTAEEIAVDKSIEMGRTLNSLDMLEQMLNSSLEGMIRRSRVYCDKGKPLAYRDMGVMLVVGDLAKINQLRQQKEQGYMAILQKLQKEKTAKASVADVESEVVTMTDELRAAAALRRVRDAQSAIPAEETRTGKKLEEPPPWDEKQDPNKSE